MWTWSWGVATRAIVFRRTNPALISMPSTPRGPTSRPGPVTWMFEDVIYARDGIDSNLRNSCSYVFPDGVRELIYPECQFCTAIDYKLTGAMNPEQPEVCPSEYSRLSH